VRVSAVLEPTGVTGVVRFVSALGRRHPHVAVFGAVHGNEPCGLRAIERLYAEILADELVLSAGTLTLVHGNPPASELQERHTRGGVDLNRQFDYRFLDDIPPHHWTYEHSRALELQPLLESVDVVLDLHSTTAPAPAFAIASPLPSSLELAVALGLPYVTQGWESPGLLGDRVLIAPLTRRGLPGVSIECGQHEERPAVDVAYACLRRGLEYLGMIAALPVAPVAASCTHLWITAAVKRPSSSFRFARPFESMQELRAGELIGCDEVLALSAQCHCYVIMPNDSVSVGDDMLYLARSLDAGESGMRASEDPAVQPLGARG